MAGVPAPSRAVFQEVAIHANVSLDGTEAALSVVCTLTAESEISVAVATEIRLEEFPTGEVVDPLTLFPGETHLVQSLTLPRVQLWQPGGGAPPPLYRAHLAVVEGERGVLDQRVIPFGVRDVRWSEEGAYRLRVNGAPVPFRVLDWDLAFPAAPAEQERLVRVVQDIGVTVLWVGGEFPGEEEFYRACDRVGLLVVRDLGSTPAAGAEAEEERLETLIRTRRSHPSLIGWSLARAAPEALREEVQAVAALEDPTRALLLWPPQGAILVPLPTEPGEGAVARVGRQYVLETNRPGDYQGILAGPVSRLVADGQRTAEGELVKTAWEPVRVCLAAPELLFLRTPVFRPQVWLHNAGPAKSLLNVVVAITDPGGRDLYQENLAAEAPAAASELAGDLDFRVPDGFQGQLLVHLSVVDEEGELVARNTYSLLVE